MSKRFKIIFVSAAFIFLASLTAFFGYNKLAALFYRPTETSLPKGVSAAEQKNNFEVEAENLKIPWEMAFLPDGDILITERPGTIKRIGKTAQTYIIREIEHAGEGGLLGLELHPKFSENRWIYVYLTSKKENNLINRVERYRLDDGNLSGKKIIIDNIPASANHDGGRIAFGPNGYLYITTGDAGDSQLAQDINSLAGKILRIKDDGSIPSDNPFGNAVYSYGHRNPQGIAWDAAGRLWAAEHGRSGALSGLDEINLIQKGKNYGWPAIQGDETREGMETPMINSGPDETWAPSGAAFWDGSLFFAGLRGQSLYEAKISLDGKIGSVVAHFRGDFGRLRAVKIGPDGFLYISTSNTDGRGEIGPGDDKIIKINPEIFRFGGF